MKKFWFTLLFVFFSFSIYAQVSTTYLEISVPSRVVGMGTNVILPVYATGSTRSFELTIESYQLDGYYDISPNFFYQSEIFYNSENTWQFESYPSKNKLKIAALGDSINLNNSIIGNLGLYVSKTPCLSEYGLFKMSLFSRSNSFVGYSSLKVLNIPKNKYEDPNNDGDSNIFDAESIWDSLGLDVSDITQVTSDLNGDGERTTYDVRLFLRKIVNPEYVFPIFDYYYYGYGMTTPITATWNKLPNGKWGLFSTDTISNGDLIEENTTSVLTGNWLKKVNNKIYFINQNSVNDPILISNTPVELSGTVNNGRKIIIETSVTDVTEEKENSLPKDFSLNQNYPNPFNPSTTISYALPSDGLVTLKVYDMLGKEVATLVNEEKLAGSYQVKFDASQLASGLYIYTIRSGNFSQTKKMILMK